MLTLTFQKVWLLSLRLPLSSVQGVLFPAGVGLHYRAVLFRGHLLVALGISRVPQPASCSYFPSVQGSDETIRVVSMDRDFHVECYHCEVGASLPGLPRPVSTVQEEGILG